jgi:DNA-binding transcriptional regulator of glucitol operon
VRPFLSRHWVWLHVAVAVAIPGFIALGWWQVLRAGAGNARSYGYAIEWPSFAAIVIVLYIRAIRMELRSAKAPVPATLSFTEPPPVIDTEGAAFETDAEDDPELVAYNQYLSDLHRRDLQQQR